MALVSTGDCSTPFVLSSRSRLSPRDLGRFEGTTLFAALGRAVCEADCLPRKEFFEAWEMARRVRRRFRGGTVLDLACGHGLLAWILLVLDDSSPRALCVDIHRPPSAQVLAEVLSDRWPRLKGRVQYVQESIESVHVPAEALVVSVHACGPLTDTVLRLAVQNKAKVAVVPCCHDLRVCDAGGLEGWVDGPLAVDLTRASFLRAQGYQVLTQSLPKEISPMNRLLMGAPAAPGA